MSNKTRFIALILYYLTEKVPDHFADVGKMIRIGKGGQREVYDIALTRIDWR